MSGAAALPPLFARAFFFAGDAQESNDEFFGWVIWLIAGLPLAIAVVIGLANKRSKQTITEFSEESFDADVLGSAEPVLVHFYSAWTIGDQVMVAQVEKIASRARDFSVGFVNVESNPGLLGLYSHLEPPALLLFAGGRRIFHCEGVFDEAEVVEEVRDAITRWRRGDLVGSEPSTVRRRGS